MNLRRASILLLPAGLIVPGAASAVAAHVELADFTGTWTGLLALAIFVLAYLFVIGEEYFGLRKSMPVLVGTGAIWFLVAWTYAQHGDIHTAEQVFRRSLEYYTELFLFLLAAMTYVNAMSERGVFAVLRHWLASRHYSLKTIYWLSGGLAFVISPFADNLTTALLIATVLVSVGGGNKRFLTLACINTVVAANAGGVFSPFGDVTTLLVWQRGVVGFEQFFALFLPALVSWLVPAIILFFWVPRGTPDVRTARAGVARGAWAITVLFVLTIAAAVLCENTLNLPGAIGMMTGLGALKLYGYYLKRQGVHEQAIDPDRPGGAVEPVEDGQAPPVAAGTAKYDIFHSLERAEWDTLMFLFGILMSVAGLAAMGYLVLASGFLYGDLGPTGANILVGVLSAVVENVPMMFTVLTMRPEMDLGQWLLVTLATGVGGSLLSIGSAAGVAVMGQARGAYTFLSHLKWTWAIALGYAAGIWVHFAVNATAFR
jgi:Na+/H+ antiporter NhaD/arsenite permease-like protein